MTSFFDINFSHVVRCSESIVHLLAFFNKSSLTDVVFVKDGLV